MPGEMFDPGYVLVPTETLPPIPVGVYQAHRDPLAPPLPAGAPGRTGFQRGGGIPIPLRNTVPPTPLVPIVLARAARA